MRTPIQPPAPSINGASLADFSFSFNLFYQQHPPVPKIIAKFALISAAHLAYETSSFQLAITLLLVQTCASF
jgi:hypothetical protein